MSKKQTNHPVLVGNTFPVSLIRRRVTIEPAGLDELCAALAERGVASFWGHPNTMAAASALLGADIAPAAERPALRLAPDGRPMLEQQVFDECWVLSPDYRTGFRPAIGDEVSAEKIANWQVLRMKWG